MDLANPDGTTTPIPDEQLPAMLAAGKISAPGPMTMVRPDGTPGTVPQEDVQRALQSGFKLVGADEAQHIANVREAAQHPVEAGALGVAQGLIPGAPSAVQALGGPDLEKQRDLSEGNPIATTAGKIAGNVGQAVVGGLLTGGAGDVAEGASLGSKVFDVADMAKQAAIFGGQGASNEINEQDLGDHGYNGEAILSQGGLGVVLGAASSPAFALAKEVLPNPITAAGKAISKASDALTSALGRTAGEGGEAGAQSIAKLGAQEAQNKVATDLADGLQGAVDKSFDQMSSVHEDLKPEQVKALTDQDIDQNVHTVKKTVDAMNTFRTNGIDPTLSKLTALADDGRISKPLVSEVETAVKDWNEATSKATTMLDYQTANHNLGRYLDDNVMKYAKDLTPGVAPVVRDVEQNIRTPLREMMREPEIMGPRLAAANGTLTDAEHALFQSTEALYRGFGFTDLLADGRPADKAKISASRVLTNLRNSEKLGQAQNNAVIKRFLDDAAHLNEVSAQIAKDGGKTTNTDEIQNLLRDVASRQTEGQATARLAGAAGGNSMNGGMGYSMGGFGPEMAAGLAGHLASATTGIPGLGAVAGGVTRGVRAVLHPASSLEMLGKIKALADGHTAQIAKGASSFFTGAGRIVAPVVAGNALKGGKDYGEHDSDTERQMAEVRNLSSNPQLLSQTMMRNTTALAEGAPITSVAVRVNAQARLNVLKAALPPQPPQGMVHQKYPQSIDAQQHFETTLQVVNHPAKAIASAMADENLTPDMVAAADASAPKTMANLRAAYQNEIVDRYDHDYTLGQKQMLSVLFKAPVTPDVAPAQVAFLQATFAPQAPTPPSGGQGKPTAGGLAKLNPGAAMATPTQARQMERQA